MRKTKEVRWLQRSPSRRHKNFVKAVYCLKISQVQLSTISHIVEPLLSVSRLWTFLFWQRYSEHFCSQGPFQVNFGHSLIAYAVSIQRACENVRRQRSRARRASSATQD